MARRGGRVVLVLAGNPLQTLMVIRGLHRVGESLGWRYRVGVASDPVVASRLRSVDAVVTVLCPPGLGELLASWGRPAVNIHVTVPQALVPAVAVDEAAIGRLGAEHLLERGYRRFAFCGQAFVFSPPRERGFADRLAEAGFGYVANGPLDRPEERFTWEELETRSRVREWVRSLPRPVAVMASTDELAERLLQACESLGLSVPADVAILGVNATSLWTEFGRPRLSSVDPGQETLGYEAARVLERLFRRRRPPRRAVIVPPRGVLTRDSTERTVFGDARVTEALRLIREEACGGLQVWDVAGALSVSRSTLERAFLAELGHTPATAIRRVRLEEARRLLSETDRPLLSVAIDAGFGSLSYLSQAFKRAYGVTPGAFRQRNRSAGPPGVLITG